MKLIRLIILSAGILGGPSSASCQPKAPPRLNQRLETIAKIKPDMKASEVLILLGKPQIISRQILFRRHIEQWAYPEWHIRIDLNVNPGEEARVLAIHVRPSPR